MARMPDGFIDLTVTSPPYDNLRKYHGYDFQFEEIAKELFRVTKQSGVVVWIVGDSTIDGSETLTSCKQKIFFREECGFNIHDTMIWARRTLPQNCNRYEPSFEYMFVLSKGIPKTFNPLKSKRKYNDMRNSKAFHRDNKANFTYNVFHQQDEVVLGNVWDTPNRGHDKIAYQHPAIFSEQLAGDHILSWSNEGDLIYDPMGGSGTVAKMSHLLKRNWIMSEISEEYCIIAGERLKPYLNQLHLI